MLVSIYTDAGLALGCVELRRNLPQYLRALRQNRYPAAPELRAMRDGAIVATSRKGWTRTAAGLGWIPESGDLLDLPQPLDLSADAILTAAEDRGDVAALRAIAEALRIGADLADRTGTLSRVAALLGAMADRTDALAQEEGR